MDFAELRRCLKKEAANFGEQYPIDFEYCLGLEPEDVIKYFEAKGLVLTESYKDMINRINEKVFTIAGVNKLNVLDFVYRELLKSLKDGSTLDQFKKNIKEKLIVSGFLPIEDPNSKILLSPSRMSLVYRQNLQNSYMAGRFMAQMGNLKNRPYLQFVGIMDRNTRHDHAELQKYFEDKVLPGSHVFWQFYYPPLSFRCRCYVRSYTKSEAEANGLKILRTIDMKKFSHAITPGFGNPPTQGFKPDVSKYSPEIQKLANGVL